MVSRSNAPESAINEQPAPAVLGASKTPRTKASRAPSKFSWTIFNFWLDSLLLLTFLALIWVSTIVQVVFPPASESPGWTLWGYRLDDWMFMQFGLTAIFAFGILVHLMLHWSWVCGVFFSRVWRRQGRATVPDDGTRTIYGVGLMIVLLNVLGLLIAAAVLSVQAPT